MMPEGCRPKPSRTASETPTGVSIWNAMREELLLNLYPLPYTTLPPAIFYVYLHPQDFDRIEGIVALGDDACAYLNLPLVVAQIDAKEWFEEVVEADA